MADEKDDKKGRTCKNAPCSCAVPDNEKFCSVQCASTQHNIQIDCDCGHADCKGDF
ncbi:MAG: hypothetical protein WCD76_03570 [Pyrinomonadaceae bacterium]